MPEAKPHVHEECVECLKKEVIRLGNELAKVENASIKLLEEIHKSTDPTIMVVASSDACAALEDVLGLTEDDFKEGD